jgi:hypothetical protein
MRPFATFLVSDLRWAPGAAWRPGCTHGVTGIEVTPVIGVPAEREAPAPVPGGRPWP